MRAVIRTGAAVRSARATRRDLLLETLALRHQLAVLARLNTCFCPADRLFCGGCRPSGGTASADPASHRPIVGIAKAYVDAGAVARDGQDDRPTI
jgi:hypothetical protein